MFHVSHAAQYCQYIRERACKAESPRGYTRFGAALLEACHEVFGQLGQTSAQQRFHDDGRYVAFLQFGVEVVGVNVASRSIFPVYIVQLNLYEVPVHLVVHGQNFVEYILCAVEREAQVTDATCLAFLHQEIDHAIFNVAGAESLDAAVANGVQQVVVDVVHLQFLERAVVHGNGVLARIVGEVGQFGSHEELLARMTLQGDAGRFFRPTLYIDRRRVVVVHTMSHSIVYQFVHGILIDDVAAFFGSREGGPAHAAVAQQ